MILVADPRIGRQLRCRDVPAVEQQGHVLGLVVVGQWISAISSLTRSLASVRRPPCGSPGPFGTGAILRFRRSCPKAVRRDGERPCLNH